MLAPRRPSQFLHSPRSTVDDDDIEVIVVPECTEDDSPPLGRQGVVSGRTAALNRRPPP